MCNKKTIVIAVLLAMLHVAGITSATSAAVTPDGPPVSGDLDLAAALELATAHNPALAAAGHRVEAADARVVQAGRWANPELEFEIENFGGSNALEGFDAAESTLLISQDLQIGGKIKRGREVAESDFVLAMRERESLELELRARTTSAFYSVLAGQERLDLKKELLSLARSFADTVDARVEAGKVSPVEATRARMEVASVRVQLIQATRELEVARVRLSSTWGSASAAFRRAVGDLPRPGDRPGREELRGLLGNTPEMQVLDDRVLRAERVVAFENSLRVPDLTVAAGPRRFSETSDHAWVAGISLPLPIFDSNKGERRAAEFELEGAARDRRSAGVEIEVGLTSVIERLDAAVEVATALEAEVVPAASSAFEAVEIGYTEGKFGFLDVIDAQRTLFEARSILLDSALEYALAKVDLERMIGRGLDVIDNSAGDPLAETGALR